MYSAVRTVLAVLVVTFAVSTTVAAESKFREDFTDAVMVNDRREMSALVKANLDKVPSLIDEIMKEVPEAETEKKLGFIYMAEAMATMYKDLTGNVEVLRSVKARSFDARVSDEVRSVAQGGVHIVDMPRGTEATDNKFAPNNIVIKKGDTVRWTNGDEIQHIFASMPFIGKGGLFTPYIDPDTSWDFIFTEAGEYFYICFIHRGMIGKITVVDDEVEVEEADAAEVEE